MALFNCQYEIGKSLTSFSFLLQLWKTSGRSGQASQWMPHFGTFRNDCGKLSKCIHNFRLLKIVSSKLQIDYVDGRARTERITDSSSTTISTTHNNGGGLITEVTIQPHHESLGTFVDSSDGGSNTPPPPPHPPRVPTSQVTMLW